MDTIFIENLTFWGRHGLLPHEKIREQPFGIDVKLYLDLKAAGQSDKLKDTLDYAAVKAVVQGVIEGKRANLLEHLAERICTELLSVTPIKRVSVTIRKPRIWREGVPGVTIERSRT